MAKVDKSQYTKEQWRIVREQRRKQKALDRERKAQKSSIGVKDTERTVNQVVNDYQPVSKGSNYIVCLKHGAKYDSTYVNNLYNMVKRHCTLFKTYRCLWLVV